MTAVRAPKQQEAFDTLAREASELAPLPVVATRLLSMATDARFSAQDLASTVSTDPALTLRILRLANSAMFGLPRRITTLREAIVLLGFREVRALALAACVIDASRGGLNDESMVEFDQFWQNSLAVGLLGQVLAEVSGVDRDEAFTAGVVHNVGRLAWAQRRPEWMRVTVLRARELGLAVHEVQQQAFHFTDADTGAAIVRNWSFPPSLCDAVANHARPGDSFQDEHALEAVIARARRYALHHGITDGVEAPLDGPPEARWMDPKVINALARFGGVEGILDRAGTFLDGSIAA